MSRSVKLDYEKLQNPGNTRILPRKLRVVQCKCESICKDWPFEYRHWSLLRWDGTLYFTAHSWAFALEIALDYSQGRR